MPTGATLVKVGSTGSTINSECAFRSNYSSNAYKWKVSHTIIWRKKKCWRIVICEFCGYWYLTKQRVQQTCKQQSKDKHEEKEELVSAAKQNCKGTSKCLIQQHLPCSLQMFTTHRVEITYYMCMWSPEVLPCSVIVLIQSFCLLVPLFPDLFVLWHLSAALKQATAFENHLPT